MLEITVHKIAQVVLMARELERDRLSEEEQASLVAVMWIGRGSFEAEELEEAKRTAYEEATTPCADYLLGTPHLSDHLENGLDALGLSASDDEDELIRGG
mgnify:CR=1 FL=1